MVVHRLMRESNISFVEEVSVQVTDCHSLTPWVAVASFCCYHHNQGHLQLTQSSTIVTAVPALQVLTAFDSVIFNSCCGVITGNHF